MVDKVSKKNITSTKIYQILFLVFLLIILLIIFFIANKIYINLTSTPPSSTPPSSTPPSSTPSSTPSSLTSMSSSPSQPELPSLLSKFDAFIINNYILIVRFISIFMSMCLFGIIINFYEIFYGDIGWSYILLIEFIAILIGLTIVSFYYSITHPVSEIADTYSKNRIEYLHKILVSLFGPRWPFTFLIFSIFIIIMLFQLYFLSDKGINININDDNFITIKTFMIWFYIIITIFVGVVGLYAFKKYLDDSKIPKNFSGDIKFNSDNSNTYVEIAAVIFFLIFLGGLASWLYYGKYKPSLKNEKNDNRSFIQKHKYLLLITSIIILIGIIVWGALTHWWGFVENFELPIDDEEENKTI
jgi:hypothetical protein